MRAFSVGLVLATLLSLVGCGEMIGGMAIGCFLGVALIPFVAIWAVVKGLTQKYDQFPCGYCGTLLKVPAENIVADCVVCQKRSMKVNNGSSIEWVSVDEAIKRNTQQ